jgi:hypothetical protein
MRHIATALLVPFILLLAGPARADQPKSEAAPTAAKTTETKDWARQDGPRLNIGIDLDMTGSVTTIPADAGAHEVNVGVMALIAYETSKIFAITVRGGYLGSVTYDGSTSKTTSDGFVAPVLVGFRLQLPLSVFRFHIEGAMGYAYGNRFNRWVDSGSGASRHQMVADVRVGAAVFFNSYLSVDAAVVYRLPNVLVRVVDSKASEYAHTMGMTVGVGFHF